jgi:hypothetical protein
LPMRSKGEDLLEVGPVWVIEEQHFEKRRVSEFGSIP